MRWRTKFTAIVGGAVAATVAAVLFGFMLFVADATRVPTGDPPVADAIVGLTGGELRIAEAGRLLSVRLGQRLLVSGVNTRTTEADVRRLTNLPPKLFSCCVDIDRVALDTFGNAEESRRWVGKHGFRSVIVVTGSYHMLRSKLELARTLPGVTLYTHPVLPGLLRRSPWWLSRSSVRLLVSEYVKVLPVLARYGAARRMSIHATGQVNPLPTRRDPNTPGTREMSGPLGVTN